MPNAQKVWFLVIVLILFAGLYYFYNHAGPVFQSVRKNFSTPFRLFDGLALKSKTAESRSPYRNEIYIDYNSKTNQIRLRMRSISASAEPIPLLNWLIKSNRGEYKITENILLRPGESLYFGVDQIISPERGTIELRDVQRKLVAETSY